MVRVLALDPGETTGYVVLGVDPEYPGRTPLLFESGTVIKELPALARVMDDYLRTGRAVEIAIEDFLLYSGASFLIGSRIVAAEVIGLVVAVASIQVPPVPVTRVHPSQKGRWPEPRLKYLFPEYRKILNPHSLAALKVGLQYLESNRMWIPQVGRARR